MPYSHLHQPNIRGTKVTLRIDKRYRQTIRLIHWAYLRGRESRRITSALHHHNIHLQLVKFSLYAASLRLELFHRLFALAQLNVEHHIMGLYLGDAFQQCAKFPLNSGLAPGQWAASSRGRKLRALHDDYTKKELRKITAKLRSI